MASGREVCETGLIRGIRAKRTMYLNKHPISNVEPLVNLIRLPRPLRPWTHKVRSLARWDFCIRLKNFTGISYDHQNLTMAAILIAHYYRGIAAPCPSPICPNTQTSNSYSTPLKKSNRRRRHWMSGEATKPGLVPSRHCLLGLGIATTMARPTKTL